MSMTSNTYLLNIPLARFPISHYAAVLLCSRVGRLILSSSTVSFYCPVHCPTFRVPPFTVPPFTMGLLEEVDGATQVLPLTPIKLSDLDNESTISNPTSPVSPKGPLILPTVLQQAAARSQAESNEVIAAARSISLIGLYGAGGQQNLFLPILQKPFFGLTGLKWLSENPLRQRGLRFRPEDDPYAFVTCQLCGNSILANREINLQNHARRHSTLKQFQCCYCHYVHSEITKVRLHMSHNHNDNYSRPINNVSPEMRESWKALMNDCFPGHVFVNDQLQRRYVQYATAAAIQAQRVKEVHTRYQPY